MRFKEPIGPKVPKALLASILGRPYSSSWVEV
jgi:hypothetical protein